MTAAQAKAQAQALNKQGRNTGAAWGPIISALGFDPRQGYGKSTALNFTKAWSSQPEGGPKPEPQPKPAAPAAPAQPKPEPKPAMPGRVYDSSHTVESSANTLGLNTDLGGIALNRDRVGWDTGYAAGGGIDTRNPYSQAMALQRHAQQDARGISTSMAARGQLYSGARQRQLDDASYRRDEADSNLRTGAQRGYEDMTQAEQGARAGYAQRQAGIESDQAGRWLDQEREWYRTYG